MGYGGVMGRFDLHYGSSSFKTLVALVPDHVAPICEFFNGLLVLLL